MKRNPIPMLERQPQLELGMPGNWFTPDDLFQELVERFGPFTLDAAADATNAKCDEYFTEEQDALAQNWHGHVFCNPPYTKLLSWVSKAFGEVKAGRCEKAVLLLPAHTSTEWFHDYALPHAEIYWIRGKRKFGGQKKSALMPSVAICFRELEESA